MSTEEDKKRVLRIFVLPKGKDTGKSKLSKPELEPKETAKEKKSKPEPFKFEFDPSEFMEAGE